MYIVGSHVLQGRGILELVRLHSWIGPFTVSLSCVVAYKILNVPDLCGRKEVSILVHFAHIVNGKRTVSTTI